jgi:hypothetical protein
MTESEWLTSRDCRAMMHFLKPPRDARVVYLFLAAVGQSILRILPEPLCQDAFDWIEHYADGEAGWDDAPDNYFLEAEMFRLERPKRANYWIWKRCLEDLTEDERQDLIGWGPNREFTSWQDILCDAAHFAESITHDGQLGLFEGEPETNFLRFMNPTFLRDIFGNPFRPVTFAPAWQTAAASSLAQSMYDRRDFAAMPVLADLLEEAGCDSAEVLSHCRDEKQVHVRGCWVVDHVLGKS